MSRPASPYLSQASPRVSSARSRRNSRSSHAPIKAFRCSSPAMSAVMSVNHSQQVASPNKKSKKRPSDLPSPETLYDELQIARKEISTQNKIITAQKTRGERLEADLKKRESQIEDILSGDGKQTTKNDQLRAKILRVERELRQKDLELGKLQFDLKTTDVNELKLAVEIYAAEVDRLRNLSQNQNALTKVSIQRERQEQIKKLKLALTSSGKEKEILRLENEKFQSQLENLRGTKVDSQIKQKREIDHLRHELRKARISNPKSVEAKEHKDICNQRENDVSVIRKENEHLKAKIDKMADAAKEYERQLKVQNENNDYRSSIEYEMKLLKDDLHKKDEEIMNQRNQINEMKKNEAKFDGQQNMHTTKSIGVSKNKNTIIEKVPDSNPSLRQNSDEDKVVGAIVAHIYRTDAISV